MKKPQLHVFVNEIFPRCLYIVKNADFKWISERFKTWDWKQLEPFNSEDCEACVYGEIRCTEYENRLGVLVVIANNNMKVQHCAHEAAHYAIEMCNAMGIAPDEHHQETFAYLVGYATKCIWKVLKNIKEK